MEVKTQRCGAVAVAKPIGPITGSDAEVFINRMHELIRENLGRVAVDASALSYVDSHGLESLANAAQELSQGGHGLKLCGASETLRQVIELTGLDSQFQHFDDINSAVRSFL